MKMNTQGRMIGAAASIAVLSTGAMADHLLTIDLSVVDQITITATGGTSLVTTSGSDTTGIYFENFYGGSGDSLSATLVSGDLTNAENPTDNSPALFRAGGGTDAGLNMWSFSSDSTVTFTAGSLAFVGSATWSLDANEYADMLAGMSGGNIWFAADDAGDLSSAMVLGSYAVIPSPGVLSLAGLGLGLGMMKRRR